MIGAQIGLLTMVPLLLAAWIACLLHERGLLSLRGLRQGARRLPGGWPLLLCMAAAAVAFGGSKGGGESPAPAVPTTYQITYGSNGGTGTMASQTMTNGVAAALSPNRFARSGHVFDGWALSVSATTAVYNDKAMVKDLAAAGKSVALHAVWKKAGGVSRHEVGATRNHVPNELGEISLPAEIIGTLAGKDDFQFVTFEPTKYMPAGTPLAVYTYTGTGSVFKAEIRRGEEPGPVLPTARFALEPESVYTLRVWASTYRADARYVVRLGTFDPFTVRFDGNGGVVSTNRMTYALGAAYGKFPTAERRGYNLTGWATAPTNGIVLATNTFVCAGYTNLYAQWKLDPTAPIDPIAPTNLPPAVTNYMVVFNANGGTGSMPTQTFVYGEAKALATNQFTWVGHAFRGWAVAAAGSVSYADRAVVSNLTATADGVVTLYAKWLAPIQTQKIDGVVWSYSTSGGEATVENYAGSGSNLTYKAAVDTSLRGTLTIPRAIGAYAVTAIGEYAFAGCASVTNIVIPETVTSIGSHAFEGCTNLVPGITIPESVESMGSSVFSGCANLRIVRYLGDPPDAEDDLYAGAPANLISGALRVRSGWEVGEAETADAESFDGEDDEDAADDGGGTTSSGGLPLPWPEGSYSRKVYWWRGVTLYSVRFKVNGGTAFGDDEGAVRYYVPGRTLGILGDLPVPEHGAEDVGFLGWYTAANGGNQVDEETMVTRSMTLYAHWQNETQRDSTEWTEEMYADDEPFVPSAATTFQGYVYTTEGSNDTSVAGLVTLKVAKGRYDREAEETNAAVTATVKLLGGAKLKLSGKMGEDGNAELTDKTEEHEMSLSIGANGFLGMLDDREVSGARHLFSGKSNADKVACNLALQAWRRTWTIVLKAEDAEGEGAAFAQGYCALSVTVGAKGRTRVKGTLPDGTKVSVSAQMLVGEGCCCVPVVAPMYTGKKGGFAFLLWLSPDAEDVWGLSGWDATTRSGGSFAAKLALIGFEEAGESALPSEASFSLEGEFEADDPPILDEWLPGGVDIAANGARWTLPKAGTVKYSRVDEAFVATSEENPSGLKLSFAAKTGTFKGSFKAYGELSETRLKKYTATVTGGVVDGVGYGTATIKKIGSVPVVIE